MIVRVSQPLHLPVLLLILSPLFPIKFKAIIPAKLAAISAPRQIHTGLARHRALFHDRWLLLSLHPALKLPVANHIKNPHRDIVHLHYKLRNLLCLLYDEYNAR